MTAEELLERYATGERDFSGVDLSGASFEEVGFDRINLEGANLSGGLLKVRAVPAKVSSFSSGKTAEVILSWPRNS